MNVSHGRAAIVVVWLVSTLLWLTPGITRPDGAGYFAYLPSTYFDRDLLFFDEWDAVRLIDQHGRLRFKDPTPTGHLSNHWTAGASLAWYPAFAGGDAAAWLLGAERSGFTTPYVAAVAFMSALAGLFVLLAGYALARRYFSEAVSASAAIAIWFGSPLAFYSLRHATMSHAISAAACAVVVLVSLRLRDEVTPSRAIAAGLAIGFACAARPQNITIALVPLILAPPIVRRAHLVFAGALLAAAPQLIASQTIYGAPLAFVNIGGRAHPWQMFATFRPFETLFSWYHGFATWTPLLVPAVAGLVVLHRKDRGLARAGLALFVSQLLLLSILERWFWGGASFGQRRFDSCFFIFVIGLAAMLDRLPRWLGALLTIATAGWTMLLFIATPSLNLNRYYSPGELTDAAMAALRDDAWRSFLGYAPAELRPDVVVAALLTAAVVAVLWFATRRRRTVLAVVYFAAMSLFYLWCGMHPKHDALSMAMLSRRDHPGARADTLGLLDHEAHYLARTGRADEAERVRLEALALRDAPP